MAKVPMFAALFLVCNGISADFSTESSVCLEGINSKFTVFDSASGKHAGFSGLILPQPIAVFDSILGFGNSGDSLQYITRDKDAYGWLRTHPDTRVKICGNLVLQITAHHHTPVLLVVDSIYSVGLIYGKGAPHPMRADDNGRSLKPSGKSTSK